MTVDAAAAVHISGDVPLDPGSAKTDGSIPVAGVDQWLTTLLQDLPKRADYQYAAAYSGAVADYCIARWLAAGRAGPPPVGEAGAEFRATLTAAGDLSEWQIDQLCSRTFGVQADLSAWLADTTERFLNIIRPWTPVWLGFTNWALRWCRQNSIGTLAFLARDALPFFVAATATEERLQLHLAHVSRATPADPATVHPILRQPTVALIDSGCYGTCINDLRQLRGTLTGGPGHDGLATLLYYSRNPQLFGYINYIMGKDILADPEAMHRATDFVIYAGDLLEALPKPYQYCAQDRTLVEPSDLVSFTISIAALSEMSEMAKASAFLETARSNDVYEQVRLLYRGYELARHRLDMRSNFLFDEPTSKSLPAPGALAGLDYLEIPPQSHIFGTASG
jgi:hypothetical protein